MFFGTGFRSSLSLYDRLVFRYFNMEPVFAVIFSASCTASITRSWKTASKLKNTTNTYTRTFDTSLEALNYINQIKYKTVPISDEDEDKNYKNIQGSKRKFSATIDTAVCTEINHHIKKIRSSFNDLLQLLISETDLEPSQIHEIVELNDTVACKIANILNINTLENSDLTLLHKKKSLEKKSLSSLESSGSSSSSPNSSNSLSSQQEAAKKSLVFNNKNEVIVFTDGACSNNGKNGATAGAGVWFGKNSPLNLSVKVPGVQTNNNAEIYSVIKAIECLKSIGLTKINIHTDSEFVIKSIKEWVPRWKSNGWKTKAGSEVKNKDMFIMLLKKIESMETVNWTHVPGHKGIVGNEEADKLARLGAKI